MRKVTLFNFVTLDGYFERPQKGDISWHRHGAEENEYAAENLKSGGTLLWAGGLCDDGKVDPVVLGRGTQIFKNIKHRLDLKLTATRTFKSGVVLLCYQPVAREQ